VIEEVARLERNLFGEARRLNFDRKIAINHGCVLRGENSEREEE